MTTEITGAEAIIKALIEQGVSTIFGYPGGAIMPTYDALHRYEGDDFRHILVRHEQAASHAAEGYARATGSVGVCMATSGPGATNLITGIADAMLDSIPIVCITGQVATGFLGTDAFQEADIIGMTVPVTKWSHQITSADEIPEMIAKAFKIAQSDRPGPVLLDITKDAQNEYFIWEQPTPKNKTRLLKSPRQPELQAIESDIETAANLLNNAKQPLILAGQGVLLSQAGNELTQLCEKADIPCALTLLGLSCLPSEHPLNVGMLGMHGHYAPNKLTNEADVIFAIGMRFDDRVTGCLKSYAKQAKIIHLDIDPHEFNKNVQTNISLCGDAKSILTKLIPLVKSKCHKNWHEKFADYQQEEDQKVINPSINPKKGGLLMAEVMEQLNQHLPSKTIYCTDVGQHQMIAARYLNLNHPLTHITSGGLGTMGFALPAAIGAQLGQPDETVVAIAGDGGIQMNIQELATIFHENIPVKIIILNNHYLGMVRQWQEMFFEKRYSSTQLPDTDFTAISKAYQIPAETVMEREELSNSLKNMMAHKGPYLLNIHVEKENNVFPMIAPGKSVSEVQLEP